MADLAHIIAAHQFDSEEGCCTCHEAYFSYHDRQEQVLLWSAHVAAEIRSIFGVISLPTSNSTTFTRASGIPFTATECREMAAELLKQAQEIE